jgi:hypothetical protein
MLRLWFMPDLILPVTIGLLAIGLSGCVGNAKPGSSARKLQPPERQALTYLEREVPAWSRQNGCYSCHNNGDGARVLYLAKRNGLRFPDTVLSDTTQWLSRPKRWDENKGDPGFSDKRLADLQFAAALAEAQSSRMVQRTALETAALRLVQGQDADGCWPIEPQNKIGSPATYGTALATQMAVRVLRQADIEKASAALRKAESWLNQLKPENVYSAAVILLSLASEASVTPLNFKRRLQSLELIRSAQTSAGGWGPYADAPPEVFDTALVLLALERFRQETGVAGQIARGRRFLVHEQRPDGSWPATTRPHGGTSYAQQISTTAWALQALIATIDLDARFAD